MWTAARVELRHIAGQLEFFLAVGVPQTHSFLEFTDQAVRAAAAAAGGGIGRTRYAAVSV